MLQIAPSKTDAERLLLVSPELGEVLAAIIRIGPRRPGDAAAGARLRPLRADAERADALLVPAASRPGAPGVISRTTLRQFLLHVLAVSGLTDASNRPLEFTPHDFRRLFATEALRSGLPPHIAAKILGHADLGTTMGYAAIYPQDVVAHHRALIARRRALRPGEETGTSPPKSGTSSSATSSSARSPSGSAPGTSEPHAPHEHSCVRCPQLRPDPAQEPRLLEIRDNLQARTAEARREGWLGEIAGLEATVRRRAETTSDESDRQPSRCHPPRHARLPLHHRPGQHLTGDTLNRPGKDRFFGRHNQLRSTTAYWVVMTLLSVLFG